MGVDPGRRSPKSAADSSSWNAAARSSDSGAGNSNTNRLDREDDCYADLHPAITVTVGYDRIGGEQAQWLHHVIDVGEYGLALEDMAGTLAQDAIAVTDQERAT
jgi:hypothetical protein